MRQSQREIHIFSCDRVIVQLSLNPNVSFVPRLLVLFHAVQRDNFATGYWVNENQSEGVSLIEIKQFVLLNVPVFNAVLHTY